MRRPTATASQLLADETGTIVNHSVDDLRVALVYPNTYSVGMSSLGFHVVYGLANAVPNVRCERYFLDLPLPETLETGMALADADVIAFSVSFELDFVNILEVLDRAGIPLLKRERTDRHPLVVVGGIAARVNRLPIYDVCDAFVHGAGETTIGPLLSTCEENRNDRDRVLQRLGGLPGIEVTANDDESAAPPPCVVERLDDYPASSVVLTPHTQFGRRSLIELSRGCPHHCTFCWAGHNITPYSTRSADSVISIVEQERARVSSFGFVAAAVGAHPQIDDICAYCDQHELQVSFSSLRVEDVTDAMLRSLARSGQRSITLAPEVGSRRLRRLLGKRLDDEQVFDVMERAIARDMRDVKLYMMTGLPTETEDEADEIVRFMERLRERFVNASRPKGVIGSISVNLGVYTPHPDTPLARVDDMPETRVVRKRVARLQRALRKLPNTRIAVASVDEARAQRLLCSGGRELLELLQLARERDGRWRAALRDWDTAMEG